ncbi:hypothetical protein VNO77_15501 [Canavalia gladiata]|uniref:Uncharacterized protein n=1 Tax=Canavalia gladiata TaxID=3824 RepID=A0AAN9M0C2_CANGL
MLRPLFKFSKKLYPDVAGLAYTSKCKTPIHLTGLASAKFNAGAVSSVPLRKGSTTVESSPIFGLPHASKYQLEKRFNGPPFKSVGILVFAPNSEMSSALRRDLLVPRLRCIGHYLTPNLMGRLGHACYSHKAQLEAPISWIPPKTV